MLQVHALTLSLESLTIEKAELELKVQSMEEEGVFRDDDSAEGEEGAFSPGPVPAAC